VDKLRQTALLMLSATHAGEVMAARDAVVRLARARRYDVHRLADAFNTALRGNGHAQANGHDDDDELSHRKMAERLQEWDDVRRWLTEKERKFVDDMAGWNRPTEKQETWLKSLYARGLRGCRR
jgi:hypothetical protein